MINIPNAVFERVGDLIKLVFRTGKNKQAILEFDGDSLETKVNSVTISKVSSSGMVIEKLTTEELTSGELATNTINEGISGAGVTVDGVTLKDGGVLLSPSVVQYVDEVTISSDDIVGTAAGDLGHANGVPLVAAPGSGLALEFVSATLIYDFDTAAYTGGAGDDLVIRIGSTSVSPAVATADLITAAADQIVHLRALAAADYDLPANAAINLKSTAVTNPGVAEIFTVEVTAAEDTGGTVVVALDGVDHTITLTADTAEVNAGEIKDYIDALDGYSATIVGAVVTVTAAEEAAQTDATFTQGTANSSAATVTVTQQGVDAAAGVIRAHVVYNVHTTGL